MSILALNSGSSSVKYGIFTSGAEVPPVRSSVDLDKGAGESARGRAIRKIVESAMQSHTIEAIGHRVVHGGEAFRDPVRIDTPVLERIRSLTPLAPLHNPACVQGIETVLESAPQLPQVAVFDTAYSAALPESAWRYALPHELADRYRIRRYGFHGISHQYVCAEAAALLQSPLKGLKLISLHLGNGASAAASHGGRCVETSMGMTPLEGLVMGTRAGDLDPSILITLQRQAGLSAEALDAMLNHDSGLLGLCGDYDMRAIRRRARNGDADARLAIDIFVHRIRKYVGAYAAVLGGLDALIFTGGIGEHDTELRAEVCNGLAFLGLHIDVRRNAGKLPLISAGERPPHLLVIPTNEELAIARATQACLGV
ncbi:MAG: acetate kinase [Candidatus Thiodiazotropha sp.]